MTTTGRVPESDMRRLRAELGPRERVLHATTPDWRAQWGELLIPFLFGLGWSALAFPAAAFCWAQALGFGPANVKAQMGFGFAVFFSLFMIPFVIVGLALLASPFLTVLRSRRTVHAITDQRILNAVMGKKVEIESFKFDVINFIKRRNHRDGTGTLKIGYGVEKDSDGDPRPLTTDWTGIANAKTVEDLIRKHAKWAW